MAEEETKDDLPYATSDVKQEVKIRMLGSGIAAEKPTTVMAKFDEVVKNHGSKPALHQKIVRVESRGFDSVMTHFRFANTY